MAYILLEVKDNDALHTIIIGSPISIVMVYYVDIYHKSAVENMSSCGYLHSTHSTGLRITRTYDNNKAIAMMRRKSPRSENIIFDRKSLSSKYF